MSSLVRFAQMSALSIVFVTCFVGCAPIKYLQFSVNEGGRQVPVQKFFNDGLGDNPVARAFVAAQQNDIPKAIQLVQQDSAQNPNDAWDHYDVGILYEAIGQWDKAEAEMQTAQRMDAASAAKAKTKPTPDFTDELAFIERHKPKR